ncbi:hypothetical protein Tcur_4610 [Thermomonospora curvata DSM 43183]|uniref:Uncharacterized protein n=1 Tax=Thermomonospora curvata (strain ATCC 19995 / DSM 43183 / JCM 3096 / KCTC 9072 / NBRC 15933 / NCIMB 10081 / Henssen B9) TaxID=471852 RepID=D1A633_THECD|nr:hypothetical protein Tcur_4610 [Thermomonospora curvata DSM 43183]
MSAGKHAGKPKDKPFEPSEEINLDTPAPEGGGKHSKGENK